MSKLSNFIEQLTNANDAKVDITYNVMANCLWHEKCYVLAEALKKSNLVTSNLLLAKKLKKELVGQYVQIIKLKLNDQSLSGHRADLIRSLFGLDSTIVTFELLKILCSENYEQAYSAYTVLANSDFELTEIDKKIAIDQLLNVKHLSFCKNQKQIKTVVADISKNMLLDS